MLEVHQPVVHAHPRRQAQALQLLRLPRAQVGGNLFARQRMHRHVGIGAGAIAHRLVALVEAPRRMQALDQRIGNRLAGLPVARVGLQHRRLGQPVFKQLRRQLDKVAQHRRARQPLVGDVGQHAVQAVAELMEQRARIFQRQKRRRPRCTLSEVVVVQHHGDGVAAAGFVAALLAQRAHPGTAALGRPREVVLHEDGKQRAGRVAHLVGLHVGVVDRQVIAGREAQSEKPLRTIERGLHHVRQREVGLDLRVVERITLLAHLFGPEAPIPGFDGLRCGACFALDLLQLLPFAVHRHQRARPDIVEQLVHRRARAGHGVGEGKVGVAGMAVQRGLFAAQHQDGAGHRPVVVLAGLLATPDPGAPG